MTPYVQEILSAIILLTLAFIAKAINDHGQNIAVIKNTLSGDNGLVQELHKVQAKLESLSSDVHTLLSWRGELERRIRSLERLEQRLMELEQKFYNRRSTDHE